MFGAACKLLSLGAMSSPNQGGAGAGGESSPGADESFHGGVTIPFQKVSSAGQAAPNGVAPLEAGQRFGEFEIIAMLGKGGMGAVYKALQVSLKRFVAIKVLERSLAMDEEFVVRFHNEAVAAAALNHPNLVQVYAAGETEGLHWFAMEFVNGESLQGRLDRTGRIEAMEAVAITLHVTNALEHAWRKGRMIHRDIKPDNIFLSVEGEVKLGDLGLAKSCEGDVGMTMVGTSMGTPLYISPEQAEGRKEIDLRTDIYSLGATLFHLLTGRPVYSGGTAVSVMVKHVSAPIPEIRALAPDLPEELAATVLRMLQKAPEDRYGGYPELAEDLQRAYARLMNPVVTYATPEPVDPVPSVSNRVPVEILQDQPTGKASGVKRRWGMVAGVVLVIAAVFGLVVGGNKGGGGSKARQSIDLLAIVDPVRDRIANPQMVGANVWERKGSALVYKSDGKAGKVAAPVAMLAKAYEIEVAFRRSTVGERFHVDIPVSPTQTVPLAIGLNKTKVTLKSEQIGEASELQTMMSGRLTVQVSRGIGSESQVSVSINGKKRANWEGNLASLAIVHGERHPDFPNEALTSLWCAKDSYEFTGWRLNILEGEVRVLSNERGPSSKGDSSANKQGFSAPGAKGLDSTAKNKNKPTVSKGRVNELIYVKGGQLPKESGLAGKGVGDFRISTYEVMLSEWNGVKSWAAGNGYDFGSRGAGYGDDHPVHSVSWFDAVKWCNARSEMEGLGVVYFVDGSAFRRGQPSVGKIEAKKTATGFRLPTEAEWEWAARGGVKSQSFKFSGGNTLDLVGWHSKNSDGSTKAVGLKNANELGIFDMSGNVSEWCWDAAPTGRRLRGGGWNYGISSSAVGGRDDSDAPDYHYFGIGFRVVRSGER